MRWTSHIDAEPQARDWRHRVRIGCTPAPEEVCYRLELIYLRADISVTFRCSGSPAWNRLHNRCEEQKQQPDDDDGSYDPTPRFKPHLPIEQVRGKGNGT